ncbi:DUF2975 domain-containing protein [Ancylomarina sp. YFZ004]
MKNNYKIINLLRRLFKVFLWLSIVNIVVVVYFVGVGFFSTSEEIGDHSKISEKTENILKEISSIEVDTKVGWTYKYSSNQVSSFHISHSLEVLLLSICVFYIFHYSHKFFVEQQKGFKTGHLFFKDNYLRIKKVGFLLLAMLLYSWFRVIVYFVLDLKNYISKMDSFQFKLDSSDLSGLIVILVIFVFAELYRAGIEMKEESEFTI